MSSPDALYCPICKEHGHLCKQASRPQAGLEQTTFRRLEYSPPQPPPPPARATPQIPAQQQAAEFQVTLEELRRLVSAFREMNSACWHLMCALDRQFPGQGFGKK